MVSTQREIAGSVAPISNVGGNRQIAQTTPRSKMPMNVSRRYPGKGMTPESKKDIDRVVAIWTECRERFGGAGNFLFGRFSIADAFYTPVVMRFRAYAVKVPPAAQAYCEAVLALSAVKEWIAAAGRETEIVPEDEPYLDKK